MAEDEVELEDWMEDSSDDPETDQLIDLLDGVDSDILFDTVNRNDIVVMDLLQQNGIEIDDEVVNAKNKDGFSVLHLAARNGLNSFCDYLLQQVKILSYFKLFFYIFLIFYFFIFFHLECFC